MGVFFYLFIKNSFLRNIIIHYQNNPVSTAIALDRRSTPVLHTSGDSKLSKATLEDPNLDNPNRPTRPDKIKNKLLDSNYWHDSCEYFILYISII